MDPDKYDRQAMGGLLVILTVIVLLVAYCDRRAEARTGDQIPPTANQYRRQLTREVRYYYGLNESVARIAALFHVESGWRSGVCSVVACGLGQQTDPTAKDLLRTYPKDLEGRVAPLDPYWSIRATVLYVRQLRAALSPFGTEAHAAALAAYNMGSGNLKKERQATALSGGDPQRWWCNVEHSCVRRPSACEESSAYPAKILLRWWPVYKRAGW